MKKILLIEDNDNIRDNTVEILELSQYEVIPAENGKIGLEKAILTIPDLIICDIMMPVLDGYGVLYALQKNDQLKNIPFIFLTAKTDKEDFRKGMNLGADDYITKPFTGTDLLAAIDARLKKHEIFKNNIKNDWNGFQKLRKMAIGKDSLLSNIEPPITNKYKKKQIIYIEGNHPHKLFYILKGKVKSYKTNEDGKELILELYKPGDYLGYIALLQNSTYNESAEALEETEMALISKEDFDHLIYHHREVTQKFIRILAKSISEKEDQLLAMAYNSLRKKVAESLLFLVKKFSTDDEECKMIDLSRESLASIAGTATESLIRTLSDFKNEKIIDIIGGNINILNLKKLDNLAN